MRIPQKPPDSDVLLREAFTTPRRIEHLLAIVKRKNQPNEERYLHWDELHRHEPPPGLSLLEWWLVLKLRREPQQHDVPLTDLGGRNFVYTQFDPIPEWLLQIDQQAAGQVSVPEPIVNAETKGQYLIRSLIEEGITSSQLEGAVTTRRVAKEMIRTGRPPRDRAERMILNNYMAMQHIGELRNEQLTPDVVYEIHRIVTSETLDDPSGAGRLRGADEERVVAEPFGPTVLHTPPPAHELEERITKMCAFANVRTPSRFVHPVLRSIILHFWLAYDHPFVDGNGRTARALFYWSMLHQRYWLCEFISISGIMLKGPMKYARAFLYTETDDNDLTYFIVYHLKVIRRALKQFFAYVDRKTDELRLLERELRGLGVLNHRQRAIIGHALRHPGNRYTIESHRLSHGVVYQTARTDLLDLAGRGLLTSRKIGRTWHFTPKDDLHERLKNLE